MATAAPQVLDLMNTLADASEEHVEEIIKALKALPQCIKASAEATKVRTTSGVKKSPSKKGRAKQQHGMGDEVYPAITQQTFTPQWTQRSPVIAFAGEDLLRTLPSTPEKNVNLARHLTPGHWTRGKLLNTHTAIRNLPGRFVARHLITSVGTEDILLRMQMKIGARRGCPEKATHDLMVEAVRPATSVQTGT
jgi:hypothetical protein